MGFALRIDQFPKSSIGRITKQHIPSTRVAPKLHKMAPSQREYPFANLVRDRTFSLKNPVSVNDRL